MSKPPKYEVEKQPTKANECGYIWQIWFEDHFVVFWTEDAANKACEAFNMIEGVKNLKRKVRNLKSALEFFDEP